MFKTLRHLATPDDPPFAAPDAAGAPKTTRGGRTEDHTRRAMDAFCTVAAHYPDMEPAARMAIAPLSARIGARGRQ